MLRGVELPLITEKRTSGPRAKKGEGKNRFRKNLAT